MALPLGKLTILIGAGVVGSYLAKEGRLPTASDVFSGAFKVAGAHELEDTSVWKRLGTSDSSAPKPKRMDNVTLQQVNSLREELQFYARRPVTIVTSTSSGGRRYYIVVVIMVVGGYLWWKGWKLPDLRFATRRSLSDARTDIEKKLQNVHSSIATTEHHVSLKLDDLGSKLDETHENSEDAHRDVRDLRDNVRTAGDKIKSFLQALKNLENTVDKFEGKQGILLSGMWTLLNFVKSLEARKAVVQIKGNTSNSQQPAIGLPLPPSRAESMPCDLSLEPLSPSPSTVCVQRTLSGNSDSGLKHDLVSNGTQASNESSSQLASVVDPSSGSGNRSSSGFGLFGGKPTGPIVTRSLSLKHKFNF